MTTTVAPDFANAELQFFTRLKELGVAPEVVFDIGGSNAAWSTTINQVYGEARYELFEPLAGRCEQYDRILEWALRTHSNFHVHPVALGEQNGHADFWAHPDPAASSMLIGNAPTEQIISIPVHRLDDLVAERSLAQPQIIKADVQGAELQIINGGRRTFERADVLHLETWLIRAYRRATPLLTELIETLKPMGHVLVQLGDYWRKPDQELISVDAFFAHRRLIERLKEQGDQYPWPANWYPG
jgi:FkbM family methyltransferase